MGEEELLHPLIKLLLFVTQSSSRFASPSLWAYGVVTSLSLFILIVTPIVLRQRWASAPPRTLPKPRVGARSPGAGPGGGAGAEGVAEGVAGGGGAGPLEGTRAPVLRRHSMNKICPWYLTEPFFSLNPILFFFPVFLSIRCDSSCASGSSRPFASVRGGRGGRLEGSALGGTPG